MQGGVLGKGMGRDKLRVGHTLNCPKVKGEK